ncbi:MAG TPA: SMP-30/gluconolactonase/LRE family protein, partial [Blastocatellia bacterium]|nr:SMP-30/gluconolactonase/LRE family protein [Blastocatellia bacterium]
AHDSNSALDRFNRSYEYDGLGDNYVRFLLDELLPEVETKKASDGRPIRLSHNGNDRAIGGESSGAICAFNAAWERPDAFSRVFSAIGTYVGLRGGDRYSTLIRKYEPKPIRIFMQDGSNDLNIYGGDWWMANQTLERALEFAGCEVQHVWGEGTHSGNHAAAIFPDAMRFLWKGWPEQVRAGASKNATLAALLVPGEGWTVAADGYQRADGLAANARGEVFFNDVVASNAYKIESKGEVRQLGPSSAKSNYQAFGPDGRLYFVSGSQKTVVAFGAAGKETVVARGIAGEGIVVAHNGNIYVSEFSNEAIGRARVRADTTGRIWLVKPDGGKQVVATDLGYPRGVMLSPDQTLLYSADSHSHWVYSFQIQSDGALQYKQRYYWLHAPDDADDSGAAGMCVDREGRLYIATRIGIQICDQAGRVNCIIPTPNGRVSSLGFGGEHFDTLYAACGDKVYKRKLNAIGANAWAEPTRPAPPKL